MSETKQDNRQRVYVHPEAEAVHHGFGVWLPCHEIPREQLRHIPPDVLVNWRRNNLIISESMFKGYFPAEWNRHHPKSEHVPVPGDGNDIKLGDEYTDDMGPEDTGLVR